MTKATAEQVQRNATGAVTALDAEGERVWTWLRSHEGRIHAITAARLAEVTALGDKAGTRIRGIIRRNLLRFPGPVVADCSSDEDGPAGYFVAVTPAEIADYLKQLRSRALEDLRRYRDVKQKALRSGFQISNGQWAYGPHTETGRLFA